MFIFKCIHNIKLFRVNEICRHYYNIHANPWVYFIYDIIIWYPWVILLIHVYIFLLFNKLNNMFQRFLHTTTIGYSFGIIVAVAVRFHIIIYMGVLRLKLKIINKNTICIRYSLRQYETGLFFICDWKFMNIIIIGVLAGIVKITRKRYHSSLLSNFKRQLVVYLIDMYKL